MRGHAHESDEENVQDAEEPCLHGHPPVLSSCLHQKVVVHLLIISTQVASAGWHFIGANALSKGVNAVVFALYREIFAGVIMCLTARWLDGRVVMLRKDYKRFLLLGLFSFGNVVGAIVALSNMTPLEFGLWLPTVPVVAMVLSFLLGIERITALKVLAVMLCVVGAITVEYFHPRRPDNGKMHDATGHIAVVVQVCSFASLIVLQKPMLARYPSCTVTAWYYTLGSLFTFLVAVFAHLQASDFDLTGHVEPWVALTYVVLIGTVYNYNVVSYCNGQTTPTTVTSYHTLQPVLSVIFSVIFVSATVSLLEVMGGMCVAAGLLTSVYARKREMTSRVVSEVKRGEELKAKAAGLFGRIRNKWVGLIDDEAVTDDKNDSDEVKLDGLCNFSLADDDDVELRSGNVEEEEDDGPVI